MKYVLIKTSPPHLRDRETTAALMWKRSLAFLPVFIAAAVSWGWEPLRLAASALLGGLAAQFLAALFFYRGLTPRGSDPFKSSLSSWVSTLFYALAFTLFLPPHLPSWAAAAGACAAVFLGKEITGGLGSSPLNPSLVGLVILGAAFPKHLFDAAGLWGGYTWIAVLASFLFLSFSRGVIWELPVLYEAGIVFGLLALHQNPWAAAFSPKVLLAACFLAPDDASTPATREGKRWFGFLAGALGAILGRGAPYGDGILFGILIMNALTPWIDQWIRPRRASK